MEKPKFTKIRKNWLISFILLMITELIFLCLELVSPTKSSLLIFMFGIPRLGIVGWITYECAYKKQGTAWLLFQLIVIPIQVLLAIGNILNITKQYGLFSFVLTSILLLSPICYFWISSLCLRRENLAINAIPANSEASA